MKILLISYKRNILLITIIIIIIIVVINTSSNSFSSDSFIESKEIIINPDQGFYRPVKVTMTPDSFSNKTNKPDQLYHLRCHIGQFSGKVNSDKKIKN